MTDPIIIRNLSDADLVEFGRQYIIERPADPEEAVSPEVEEFVAQVEERIAKNIAQPSEEDEDDRPTKKARRGRR
jgi:hypothetical protein